LEIEGEGGEVEPALVGGGVMAIEAGLELRRRDVF
jgi:hypothetical protein